MANYLEYILSLKDRMSPGLKTVGAGSVKAKGDIQGLESQVQHLDNTLKKVAGGGFTIFKNAMGNMLGNMMTRIASIGPQIGNAIYEGTVKREQDIVGLTTFVGDHAREVYANIQKDAAATPFNTQSLLDVNRALISTGMSSEQARKDTLNLANAISAVGKGNFELMNMAVNMQQIKNIGKASAIDIKQFGIAGINIYQVLANATGKSLAQVQEMEVSYELLSYALEKAAGKGGIFEGAMAKQSKTLGGLMETAFDNVSKLLTDFGETLRPLFEKGLGYLQAFVDKAPQIFTAIQPVVMAVGDIFFFLIDTVVAVGKGFVWVWDQIQKGNPWLIALATIVVGITAYLISMETAALAVAIATGIWEGAQWLLNAALTANPVGLIIAAIVALIALIGYLIYNISGWGKMWDYTVKGMKMIWDSVISSFKLTWLVAENFILSGFDKLKIAWYKLKSIWDEDGANAALSQVEAQQNARAKAIADENKKGTELLFGGLNNLGQGFNSLKWEGKGFGAIKSDIANALGIAPPHQPGQADKVMTSFGGGGGKASKGGRGKGSEAVATGGQRSVTVNVSYGNAVGTFNLTTVAAEDGAGKLEDLIIDTVARSVAQGASLGAY